MYFFCRRFDMFLTHKKPDDGQSHTYDECSGLKLAEAGQKKKPIALMASSYHGQEVIGIINVNEPIEIFGMMFVTYDKHKRELLNNYLNLRFRSKVTILSL